ncbi:hypothetical protein B0T25DRAFT_235626 [Lasiosphaeria hispida]|uniref:Uncharacterized protein n=1 Tax=Lasiosphaeria hispida TaxID=260671 RepID=A0AAJ0HEH4_9PEZI|nr:hypothetical protein B0T25DRAFT_235626 [Lasiosphaeria hispida]
MSETSQNTLLPCRNPFGGGTEIPPPHLTPCEFSRSRPLLLALLSLTRLAISRLVQDPSGAVQEGTDLCGLGGHALELFLELHIRLVLGQLHLRSGDDGAVLLGLGRFARGRGVLGPLLQDGDACVGLVQGRLETVVFLSEDSHSALEDLFYVTVAFGSLGHFSGCVFFFFFFFFLLVSLLVLIRM